MSEEKRKYQNKYWENEESETVEFGNSFFRAFDESGKLQIGRIIKNKAGEKVYLVKAVIDRTELLKSEEALDFLNGTLAMWEGESK